MHHEENPYAGQGPVLLDIGDDVGALVIAMPARLEGREVEVCRRDVPGQPTHVGVVARPTLEGPRFAAVFPSLAQGAYVVRELPDGEPVMAVDVVGGLVAEASWPDRPSGPDRARPDRAAPV